MTNVRYKIKMNRLKVYNDKRQLICVKKNVKMSMLYADTLSHGYIFVHTMLLRTAQKVRHLIFTCIYY